MIEVSVKLNVIPEIRETVLEILYSLLEPMRVIPGCISCHLYQDVENQNRITYVETWRNQTDLERHISSAQYKNILFAIEMGTEPPEINFKTITNSSGMETITSLRQLN